MSEQIKIHKTRTGYMLTVAPGAALLVTFQQMRDIYDFCLLHMAEIEAEGKQAKGEQPHETT